MHNHGKSLVGYNAQIITDAKNKLIIDSDICINRNDKGQLEPAVNKIKAIKKRLKSKSNSILIADSGYFNENQIIATNGKENIKVIVSDPREIKKIKVNKVPANGFDVDDFKYNKKQNTFLCPEKKILFCVSKKPTLNKPGKYVNHYRSKKCKTCNSKSLCTKNKHGRQLNISVNYEQIQTYKQKMKNKNNKLLIKERKALIEHLFGTIKQSFGYRQFLLCGLDKVKAEFDLMCLAYNMKRVLAIFSVNDLIAALK